MKLIYAFVLLIAMSGCEPGGEAPSPDVEPTNTVTTEPHAYATGELYLDFADGELGGDTNNGHSPVDACYFTGPDEAVVLVEFDDAPQVVQVSRECGNADPYRSSHSLISATIIRDAFGTNLQNVEAIAYSQYIRSAGGQENSLRNAQAGRIELWSMRRGGADWFVMNRWPVTALSKDSDTVGTSAGLALPTNWTELVDALREAHEQHPTLCTDPGDLLYGQTRQMTDSEFDTWAHTPDSDTCDSPPVADRDLGVPDSGAEGMD